MISREPTIERLAIARALLLDPFDLDETHLGRALAEIRAHRVDDADLYFQYTRQRRLEPRGGHRQDRQLHIDQGVGVRAVSGEKTAFAYSDDISEASLLDAARTVRTIARPAARQGQGRPPRSVRRQPRRSTRRIDPIASLDTPRR